MRSTVGFCILSMVFSVMSCDAANTEELKSKKSDDLTPAQVDSLMAVDSSHVLLDVRTAPEFVGSLGHLRGAVLIPVQELESRMNELESYRGKIIVVYCRVGVRSVEKRSSVKENQD